MATEQMGKAGLLWVGEKFYRGPMEFCEEARAMGVSRRISQVPREFVVGETWVLFAHPRVVPCVDCFGSGYQKLEGQGRPCHGCKASGKRAAIFYVVRPQRLEMIITETQSKDPEFMDSITKRHLTPVVVPDNDRDHQGTAYDDEEEAAA